MSLAVDFSATNVNLVANGLLSFTGVTTNFTGELLVFVCAGDAGATSNVSITSTGGLTWTKSSSNVTAHGSVYIFTAVAASTISNQTITSTDSVDTTTHWGGALYSFTGADNTNRIGATATGLQTTSGALSETLTTTNLNSWVWAVADDYATSQTHTLGAGQTSICNELDASAGNTYMVWQQTTTTQPINTVVTMNTTTASEYVWELFEILAPPAIATGQFLITAI